MFSDSEFSLEFVIFRRDLQRLFQNCGKSRITAGNQCILGKCPDIIGRIFQFGKCWSKSRFGVTSSSGELGVHPCLLVRLAVRDLLPQRRHLLLDLALERLVRLAERTRLVLEGLDLGCR